MVYGVVGRIGGPACSEAEDRGCEAKDGACLSDADLHGQVAEFAAVGEFAKHDQEDDEGGDPGPEFIDVHDFVAEEGDEKCAGGDYDDACVSGHVGVYGVDELGAHDNIDRGPADAGEDVEDGDDLDAVEPEEEAGEDHLAETEARAEGGEEGDGCDGEAVDEEDGEEGIDETELEDGDGEGANGEGGDDHVGGEPLSSLALE